LGTEIREEQKNNYIDMIYEYDDFK